MDAIERWEMFLALVALTGSATELQVVWLHDVLGLSWRETTVIAGRKTRNVHLAHSAAMARMGRL